MLLFYYSVGLALAAMATGADLGKFGGVRPLDLMGYALAAIVWPLWVVLAANKLMKEKRK